MVTRRPAMHVPLGMRLTPISLVVSLVVAGCSPPPPPSAATEALEPALLTVADVGGDFEEMFRGGVGVGGGSVCPESEFEIESAGAERVEFVWALEDDRDVTLEEFVRVVESEGIDTFMEGLTAAYDSCFGVVWTDYGQTQTVEPYAVPSTGDARIGVLWLGGDPPFDGRIDASRKIFVAVGDVFAEVSVSQALDGRSANPTLSDGDFHRIIETAVANLAD
jgi:hypothetical protein